MASSIQTYTTGDIAFLRAVKAAGGKMTAAEFGDSLSPKMTESSVRQKLQKCRSIHKRAKGENVPFPIPSFKGEGEGRRTVERVSVDDALDLLGDL